MRDWIIEADMYRLRRAIQEENQPGRRAFLARLLAEKQRALAAMLVARVAPETATSEAILSSEAARHA